MFFFGNFAKNYHFKKYIFSISFFFEFCIKNVNNFLKLFFTSSFLHFVWNFSVNLSCRRKAEFKRILRSNILFLYEFQKEQWKTNGNYTISTSDSTNGDTCIIKEKIIVGLVRIELRRGFKLNCSILFFPKMRKNYFAPLQPTCMG